MKQACIFQGCVTQNKQSTTQQPPSDRKQLRPHRMQRLAVDDRTQIADISASLQSPTLNLHNLVCET